MVFLACEKYVNDSSSMLNPTTVKEKYISNDKLERIFNNLGLEKYYLYNTSNKMGTKKKTDCIESLLYATYCLFEMDKASKVLDILNTYDAYNM